jgi:hypothetical protein
MDGEQIDVITKIMRGGSTRRSALIGVLGGVLLGQIEAKGAAADAPLLCHTDCGRTCSEVEGAQHRDCMRSCLAACGIPPDK